MDQVSTASTDAIAEPAMRPTVDHAPSVALDAVLDVPVRVQAILARRQMSVGELLALTPGTIVPLDKRVGEPVEIMINGQPVGRGELVRVDDGFGVTMTEIIRVER